MTTMYAFIITYTRCIDRYEVESNEFSGVFCTIAHWLFNRCQLSSEVHMYCNTPNILQHTGYAATG